MEIARILVRAHPMRGLPDLMFDHHGVQPDIHLKYVKQHGYKFVPKIQQRCYIGETFKLTNNFRKVPVIM